MINMNNLEKSIHEAYRFLRTNNHTIPSEHLEFIKDAALKAVRESGELSATEKSMMKVDKSNRFEDTYIPFDLLDEDNLWLESN